MEKIKKIAVVIIVVGLIIAVAISFGENDPELRANYQVVEDMRLRINLEAAEEGNEIELYNPENESVGKTEVTSEDITRRFIGVMQSTVKLPLAEEGNPITGEYTIVVRGSAGGEVIYEDKLTFEGPDVEITDIELSTGPEEGEGLWKLNTEVENQGDLPILVDEINLEIEDEFERVPLDEEIELMPEGSESLQGNVTMDVGENEKLVRVEILSFGEVYAYSETEIVIGG